MLQTLKVYARRHRMNKIVEGLVMISKINQNKI